MRIWILSIRCPLFWAFKRELPKCAFVAHFLSVDFPGIELFNNIPNIFLNPEDTNEIDHSYMLSAGSPHVAVIYNNQLKDWE